MSRGRLDSGCVSPGRLSLGRASPGCPESGEREPRIRGKGTGRRPVPFRVSFAQDEAGVPTPGRGPAAGASQTAIAMSTRECSCARSAPSRAWSETPLRKVV